MTAHFRISEQEHADAARLFGKLTSRAWAFLVFVLAVLGVAMLFEPRMVQAPLAA